MRANTRDGRITDDTGVKTLSYDAGGALTDNGFLFTATATETTAADATTARFTNAQALCQVARFA